MALFLTFVMLALPAIVGGSLERRLLVLMVGSQALILHHVITLVG